MNQWKPNQHTVRGSKFSPDTDPENESKPDNEMARHQQIRDDRKKEVNRIAHQLALDIYGSGQTFREILVMINVAFDKLEML